MTKFLENKKNSFLLFLLIFVLNSVMYMTKNMFSSSMAIIVEDGFMTKSQTGLISAMFWFIYAVFQFVGGFAADKIAPQKLISIGLISGAISNLIIYFNHDYWVIMVVWCLNAVFQFGLWPSCFKIVSSKLCKEIVDTAIFWILFTTSVGQILSMLVASLTPNWTINFMISAISLIVVLIIWILSYPVLEFKIAMTENVVVKDSATAVKPTVKLSKVMTKTGLIVIMFAYFIVNTLCNGIKLVTPSMLTESYESIPAAIATRMSITLIVFGIIGMLLSNVVRRKITDNEVKASLLLLSIVVPMLVGSYFVGNISFVIILALLSVAITIIQATSPFLCTYIVSRFIKFGLVGTVTGIANAFAAFGNVVASYVFPKMSELMSWNMVVLFWVVIVVVSVISLILVLPKWTRFIKDKTVI